MRRQYITQKKQQIIGTDSKDIHIMEISDKDIKEKHDEMFSRNDKDQNHDFIRE